MSPRTITLLVVLTAAALASWYLARNKGPAEIDERPYDTVHRGYYLKSARILGTGEDGSLLYEIDAAYAEQKAKDRIEFTEVRIRYSPHSADMCARWATAATTRMRPRFAPSTWNLIPSAFSQRPTNVYKSA